MEIQVFSLYTKFKKMAKKLILIYSKRIPNTQKCKNKRKEIKNLLWQNHFLETAGNLD